MSGGTFRELPFWALPRQPGPFLKYVRGSEEALPVYESRPTLENVGEAARALRSFQFDRERICRILSRQNDALGADASVRNSIDVLRRPGSVAVVTGQQVGLFTGPALTIYKALTAIRLSAELRLRGADAIPIFWMATDDHDLAEITRMVIAGSGNAYSIVDTRPRLFGDAARPPFPVGSIRLPESIRDVVGMYSASLPGPFAEDCTAGIASSYEPGRTFSEAFGKMLSGLMQGRGLIVFDPRDPDAKELAAPVIRRALDQAPELRRQLHARASDLRAAGMEPQVAILPRSTLVFFEDAGGRRLLVSQDGGFGVKDTETRFAAESIGQLAQQQPGRFSPNVLLRPVVQDHLFPTVAYVGGPAEISYFAQLAPLYRYYARPAPVAWPRSSFTVIDEQSRATLQRHRLDFEDCFAGLDPILEKILLRDRPELEGRISDLSAFVDREIGALNPMVARVDPSLGPAAETVRRKMLYRAASLRAAILKSEVRANGPLGQEIAHLLHCCYPVGNLQEREINIHDLIARHGPSLLDAIESQIDLAAFSHKVLLP